MIEQLLTTKIFQHSHQDITLTFLQNTVTSKVNVYQTWHITFTVFAYWPPVAAGGGAEGVGATTNQKFKSHYLETLQAVFVNTKTVYFSWEVGPTASVSVATKAGT